MSPSARVALKHNVGTLVESEAVVLVVYDTNMKVAQL
jgi:hypothetical protein